MKTLRVIYPSLLAIIAALLTGDWRLVLVCFCFVVALDAIQEEQ